MANIMLTYRCNLHCSYCFANEFVNKDRTDITIRNFIEAVSFITRRKKETVGLIGGEPTLHPGFQLIMDMLTDNPKVAKIRLFTNGLLIDRFIPQIVNPKVEVLVNCNSPHEIGEEAFDRIRQNLDALILQHGMKDRIGLGINLYHNKLDYSYIMELLQRYDMHRVRFSVTVPDFSTCGTADALAYFSKRKKYLWDFYHDMDSIQVMPHSDCNHPPYCIWTDEEKKWLEAYAARYPESNSNLTGNHSRCIPAIDILPDLKAVRCFGMSDYMKVSIKDFRNLRDISNFFTNEIDSYAFQLPACDACKDCYEQKVKRCVAGCMGFKSSRIRACAELTRQM